MSLTFPSFLTSIDRLSASPGAIVTKPELPAVEASIAGRKRGATESRIVNVEVKFESFSETIIVTLPESDGVAIVDRRIAIVVVSLKVGITLATCNSEGITSQAFG